MVKSEMYHALFGSVPKTVRVEGLTMTFSQDSDSNQSSSDGAGQELVVSIEDAGGGTYVVLKTDRWAVDADELGWLAEVCRTGVKMVDEARAKESPGN
jgi:hypothetical protein